MISVICPVFNEESNIKRLIDFFISSKPLEKELYLVDGGSTDQTVPIIKHAIASHNNIYLLYNEYKYVSFALNKAINKSEGDVIIRLDAHTEYASDYFEKILSTFELTDADVVGGPMNAVGKTNFQKAVAYVTSCKFGIGNSKIHVLNYNGESDHVYLGAWKRKIFEEIGYFDERLNRNQDDEFHYRAKSLGKKIYLNSEIKSYYYPRNSWWKLIVQYFQYGLFKPIVSQKIRSEIKLRHIVPSIFTVYLFLLSFFLYYPFTYFPLIVYSLMALFYSLKNLLPFQIKIISLTLFPTIHLSYGLGYIVGLIRLFK